MKLYAHQQRFIDENPDKAMLVWETGTGKTVAACAWLKLRPKRRALVVCPKAIVGKWERDLEDYGVAAVVVSRDYVKQLDLTPYDTLILDEAQDFASALFIKGRSARASVIYNFIKSHQYAHVLLLTATPIRSTAWNAHTLGTYIGHYTDWKKFRKEHFYLTDMFSRWHYEPKKTWRKDIRPYLESISDIVLARDCADIPEQRHHVIEIPTEKKVAVKYREAAATWHDEHRAENGKKKFEVLSKMLDGYRKAVVIVYYREQIEDYIKWIGNDRQVFVLHGGVKDQDAVIQAARESDDCVFIVQASMGAGFDASEFSVMIFASMSFKFVDHIQALGRINRLNNLHPNDYYYLLAGPCDKNVYKTIMAGHDFHPPSYMK